VLKSRVLLTQFFTFLLGVSSFDSVLLCRATVPGLLRFADCIETRFVVILSPAFWAFGRYCTDLEGEEGDGKSNPSGSNLGLNV